MNCLKVLVLIKMEYFLKAVFRNGLGSSLTSISFGNAGILTNLPSSLASLICSDWLLSIVKTGLKV